MKRGISLLILVFCVLPDLAGWPLPPALETGHLLGKGLASGVPPLPLYDEFYALGWSPEGAFASLERRTLPGGSRSVRFRVVDLVEDRELYEETWEDWGLEDAKGDWWEAHRAGVVQVFDRFRLAPTTWQLGVFPLILDNEFYTLALRTSVRSDDPGWLERIEILVHSTGRGIKSVQNIRGYWHWATLLGFLPSPFENRVALIFLVQPSGWQGSQQPLRFLVTGLSLKAGFPKP